VAGSNEASGAVRGSVDELAEPLLVPWFPPKEPEVDVIKAEGTGGR
jgi:hypothetical protein